VSGGIFLRRGANLIQMSEQDYATEAELQALLADHPDLLSADGEPHRWLLVAREFGIASEVDGSNRWSVDHLFLDELGTPTLVEVKRSTDTRIRREVVGQMLDYAANALSYWDLETIRARFEANLGDTDPAEVIAMALGTEIDPDAFWQDVGTNLAAGRLRLVFVADVIPDELRAIVEFLNQQMSPADVLAVEIRQYVDGSGKHQTLVPRLIGETQSARRAKRHIPRVTWSEESWLEALRSARGGRDAELAERLLTWAREHRLEVRIGTGAKAPSAMLRLPGRFTLLAISPGFTQCRIELYLGSLRDATPFDQPGIRRELKARLDTIPGVKIQERQLEKFPSFPIAAVANQEAFDRFTATLEWVLSSIEPT
jgi:hypothetical protein